MAWEGGRGYGGERMARVLGCVEAWGSRPVLVFLNFYVIFPMVDCYYLKNNSISLGGIAINI